MRTLSITMFSLIGLLLGSKIGLHIWQLTDQQVTLSITEQPAAVAVSDMIIPAPSEHVATAPAPLPPAMDSLAMIESFLIPSANAESAPGSYGGAGSRIEDKTLGSLRQLKAGLDERSNSLDQREQSLEQAEARLTQRISELEQLEASIQQRLSDESKIKSKKIKRLTAVYEGMKPDRSAPVIARMELATVVKIFLLMDEKKVGKILSYLPPDKAVSISQALTRRISSVK